jgi:hypothetical protein
MDVEFEKDGIVKTTHIKFEDDLKAVGWTRVMPEQEPQDDIEELKALCDERGIKYHHKAGVTKLKDLLEG